MKEIKEKYSLKYYHTIRYTATIRNTKCIHMLLGLQKTLQTT
jgi:hypothetical protein